MLTRSVKLYIITIYLLYIYYLDIICIYEIQRFLFFFTVS